MWEKNVCSSVWWVIELCKCVWPQCDLLKKKCFFYVHGNGVLHAVLKNCTLAFFVSISVGIDAYSLSNYHGDIY